MRIKYENAVVILFACGLERETYIYIYLSVICRYFRSLYLLNVNPIIKTVKFNTSSDSVK